MNNDMMLGLIFGLLAVNFIGMVIVGIRVEVRGVRNEVYDRRIAVLEENTRTAPSHNDLNAIRDRIAGVSGQVAGMSQVMNVQTDLLRSIQNHLLEREL